MKLLIGIRMKAFFAAIKKSCGGKKGMGIFLGICMVFLIFSVEAMLFGSWNLMSAFLDTGFAWLFFALAGLLAFAFGILGTVFTTQAQMYQAKDNDLLLAMPIKPGAIVGSRVFVLYLLTMVFVVVVMLPAGVVYTMKAGFSVRFWFVYLVSMILIGLITQAVTCLLGWLLHFILAGFRHKAIVATVFMTAVMVLYFVGIGQIENLMLLLITNGGKIASAIQSFAWPFYALGVACFGDWLRFVLLALVCILVFAVVATILNVTFVRAMLVGSKSKKSVKQKRDGKVRTAMGAVCRKECKRFFSSTTYLVNIGMGLFMIVAFVGAGVIMKDKLTIAMFLIPGIDFEKLLPAFMTGATGMLAAMSPISAPSVSLEGKNIWILRSMPISGADVLKAKLRFHCIASVPVAAVGAVVLGIVYERSVAEVILMGIGSALLFVLVGVLGLVFNMCFPRLDWANEAGPIKQSMAVLFSMFGMMLISVGYVALCFGLTELFGSARNAVWEFALVNVLFAGITCLLYLLMVKWGGKKFETL